MTAPRITVVGLGRQGLSEVTYLLSHPSDWNVVSVVDPSASAYARFQARHHEDGIPCFDTVADALAAEDFDAVVIATTAPWHVPVATSLLDAGFRGGVLIEKPIAPSLGAARQFRRLSAEARVHGTHAVNFQRRFAAPFVVIKEALETGAYGRLRQIIYNRRCKLAMKGSHYLDLGLWLAEARPSSVSARLDTTSSVDHRGSAFFDPSGRIEATLANGVQLVIDGRGSSDEREGFSVVCDEATLHVDVAETRASVIAADGSSCVLGTDAGDPFPWFERALRAVIQTVPHPNLCTLDDAIAALEVLVAAYLSHEKGRAVEIPLSPEDETKRLPIA